MPTLSGLRADDQRLRNLKNLAGVKRLELHNTSITDDGVVVLNQAKRLEELEIASDFLTDGCMPVFCSIVTLVRLYIQSCPKITDRGVSYVTNARQLEELYLKRTQLTDVGMAYLRQLNQLWSLSLEGTEITDDGLHQLERLPALGLLSLHGTQVTGPGLAFIPNNEDLNLYLDECPIDDGSMDFIVKHLSNLRRLGLRSTAVTDASVAALRRLPKLMTLFLNNTAISDDALEFIAEMPNLDCVYLQETQVTAKGVAELKKKRRKMLVYSDHRGE